HGVANEAHSPQHQEYADRRAAECQGDHGGQRAAHELEFGEGGDQRIVQQHGQAAREEVLSATQAAAPSSNASHIRRASSRLSGVSTSAVKPQATLPRASSRVSGKLARTRSKSCSAASTVRPSACQRRTSAKRSAEVRASMALNGSSSTIMRASCNSTRANSMRCICPPDSVPIARFSKPLRPTEASACAIFSRAPLPMPPKKPVARQSPVPTKSYTEIGK